MPKSNRPLSLASQDPSARWNNIVQRRSFLHNLGAFGVAVPAAALLPVAIGADSAQLAAGDVAILRFLAAAELIEADLWVQYAELGGIPEGNPAYTAALENIDDDMPQYITDNTGDELSHAAFLNAYLVSKGQNPVNLDSFRTLPSSKATGARQIGRLTNLLGNNVDTSWYTRYRSTKNPDLGATFPQAVRIIGEPLIPLNDSDTPPDQMQPVPPVTASQSRMQAIANSAAFHFAMIEQGGSSLYTSMSLKVTNLEVLRVVVSIGGVEVNHFAIWHDKAGNAVSDPLAGVTDPETGVTFPDLNARVIGGDLFETSLIMPEPCDFLSKGLPVCSVIRPSSTENAGAQAAVKALTDNLLFAGQSQAFFDALHAMAAAADAAQRGI